MPFVIFIADSERDGGYSLTPPSYGPATLPGRSSLPDPERGGGSSLTSSGQVGHTCNCAKIEGKLTL
jgi:hypothetical protein